MTGVNTSRSFAVSTDQLAGTLNVAPPGDTFAVSAGTTSAFDRASCADTAPAPIHPIANSTPIRTTMGFPFPFPLLRIFMESTSQ